MNVQNLPIFGEASDAERLEKHLSETSEILSFSRGDILLSPDRNGEVPVMFLLSGNISVSEGDREKEVLLRTAGPRSVFGLVTLYGGAETFPTTVRALGDVTVLSVPAAEFRKAVERDIGVRDALFAYLCRRVAFLNRRIRSFTAGSAEKRLALFLLDAVNGDGSVVPVASMSALAASLDIGRASLYRALDTLTAKGGCEKTADGIRVLSRDALGAIERNG